MGLEERRQDEVQKYVEVYQDETKQHFGRPGELLQEMIRELLTRVGGKSLLDVGCGHRVAMGIARELGYQSIAGTEAVPELCGDDVAYALAHDLPFPPECFDVVLSTGVLEHLLPEDTDPALREMALVARKHVVITLNNDPSYYHINCPTYEEWTRRFESVFSSVEYLGDMGNGGKNRAWICQP